MPNVPIIAIIFFILLVLPFQVPPRYLKSLAFFLWLTGGLVLMYFGVMRLIAADSQQLQTATYIAMAVALAVGFGKGSFVLSKTSQRNIDRLNAINEPLKLIHVYSIRSWIIIGIMVLISLSLTFFNAPLFWRGLVNIAIGFGLVISSFAYLKALRDEKDAEKSANSV
ncbi:MAG: hypothetical protein AB7P76_02510 [Candidatus Melainabacteria bacterium]